MHVVNSSVLWLRAWSWPCSLTPLQEQKSPNAGLISRKSLFIYLFIHYFFFLIDIKLGKKKPSSLLFTYLFLQMGNMHTKLAVVRWRCWLPSSEPLQNLLMWSGKHKDTGPYYGIAHISLCYDVFGLSQRCWWLDSMIWKLFSDMDDYVSLNYARRIQEAGEAQHSWGWAENFWVEGGEEWRASWDLWEVTRVKESGASRRSVTNAGGAERSDWEFLFVQQCICF